MNNHCKRGWGILALTLIGLLVIQGCVQPMAGSSGTGVENPIDPDQNTKVPGPDESGNQMGKVSVRIQRLGKTAAVNPDFSGLTDFVLDFNSAQGTSAPQKAFGRDETVTVSLKTGVWTITVSAFIKSGTNETPAAVIRGSAQVEVKGGEAKDLQLVMDQPGSMTQGSLRTQVNFPRNMVSSALLNLFKLEDDGTSSPGSPVKDLNLLQLGSEDVRISLDPGLYRLELDFFSKNSQVSRTELVQIYPQMETGAAPAPVTEDDFHIPEFANVETLKAYLASLPDNTVRNPYSIKIKDFDLSSKENSGNTLKTLYAALSQYVRLDLSDCFGDTYISMTGNSSQRARIVSLILPNTVLTIEANGFSGYEGLISVNAPKVTKLGHGVFKDSKDLKSVLMPELQTIEGGTSSKPGAFKDCGALVSVSFPQLTDLGAYTFYRCGKLTSVSLPKLKTIGDSAFTDCSSLTSLSFPEVQSVGSSAFRGSENLSVVELPQAAYLGNNCFTTCTALNRVVLGANPPTLGGSSLFASGKPQDGIYVPQGALENYESMTQEEHWTKTLKDKVKSL